MNIDLPGVLAQPLPLPDEQPKEGSESDLACAVATAELCVLADDDAEGGSSSGIWQ